MLRSNSQLASLIADAGLVGTKSMQRRSSEAASDGTLLGGQFDVPSSAAPSLYEFRPQQPQNKRIVHRTSSARAAMPPRSPSAHASTPSPINSSSIPPIYRNTVKATTAAKGTASPGLTGSVITLPPATSVMDGPEPSPYKRSDPVSLQSIQQAWATDPGSAQSLEYSLPRPLADALNAAAAATEGASRILNLNHTQSDESSLSMQLSMENSSLMTLISELRSQLLNQSEQSMNLLTVAARRGEDLSTKLNTVLMERQVERDENAHKLSLMRDKEEEKRRDLELSLSDMRLQFETAKKGYETQIDRLKMELQSFSDKDSGLKGLKAIKAVEDKLEKSESARRTAERKALSFEHDLTLLRSQLETKLRESDNILSQLAAEKASSQQLRMDLDAKVITAAEEGKAQVRKQLQSLEADKKSLSEVKDKLEADLGKRTQTLLAAQADLDALKATVQAQDAKITQLLKDKEQLQEKLDHVSMSAKEGTILGPELDIKSSDGRTQGDRPGQLSTPPRPSSSSKRQAATPPSPQLSSDVAKLQRMLIDVKEEYCSRLVHMEGELQRAETSALTYASQLDRMASGLAARTAILLKSRFSAASSYLPSSSASSVNGDTDCPHSSRMNSSRNLEKSQLTKSILQQMNDKLASENAALLVEVARLQANQVKSKLARGSSDGDPPLTPSSPSVAQDALNMTMKEALLSSRNRSLALVLTPEGWEGSSTTNQALFHQTKNPADLAIDAAEEDLRSRASNLALMAQLRALKIDLHEAGTKLFVQANLESELQQVKKELSQAEARIRSMETESRMLRTGIVKDDTPAATTQPHYDDKLEDKMRAAKDEANRHKLLASAAKREKDLMEQELEDTRRRIQRLEGQVKEARSDAAKSDEANKRLRSILLQARTLLKDVGVEFLEDVSYESLGSLTGGGKGSVRSSEAGSIARQSTDGTLFKALDQREKDREMVRMQREVNEAQYTANVASKELKKVKNQLSQTQSELQKEKEGKEKELQLLIDELAEVKGQKKRAEDEKQVADARCTEMKKELVTSKASLSKLSLDLNYLQARSTLPRPKPKLSFAVALALSVAPQ